MAPGKAREPPVTEQRKDPGTRDRFGRLEKRLDAKYAKVARRVTVALVVVSVSLGLAAYGLQQQRSHDSKTLHRIATEGNERRDQTCRLFEKQADESVRQLAQTYKFLERPSPGLRGLVPLVLSGLARTEAEAHVPAPAYCDAPGVGLPEPNPRIPPRPPALTMPTARGPLAHFPR